MPVTVVGPPPASRLARPLGRLVRAAVVKAGGKSGAIEITLTDDAALRALNQSWRGIDRATDVLSFHYHDEGQPVAGDLVISTDRWHEQARRYRTTRARELARLVVHGALHLAGLDHHRADERRAMRVHEDRVLKSQAAVIRELERILDRPAAARPRRAASSARPSSTRRRAS
jgi:probable rRNA maturation factor